MTKLSVTPEKWNINHWSPELVQSEQTGLIVADVNPYDNNGKQHANSLYVKDKEKALFNAKLIADAGTTYNKCGLLPSELMEQRKTALSALLVAKNALRMAALIDKSNTCDKAEEIVSKAIKNISL